MAAALAFRVGKEQVEIPELLKSFGEPCYQITLVSKHQHPQRIMLDKKVNPACITNPISYLVYLI
jgi:hypothetical protein